MCLVVPYVKGVAYKIFCQMSDGTLVSPINGLRSYPINKWITDTNQHTIAITKQSTYYKDDNRICNHDIGDRYPADIRHEPGFFCYPSLQDAEVAYELASYLHARNLAIYRINYKKVVAQGIDESTRPTLVVRMMRVVKKEKDLDS
jgi:hypothetical protein